MAAVIKNVNMLRTVNTVTKLLSNLSVSSSIVSDPIRVFKPRISLHQCAFLHTTPKRHDLMEFFDDKKNWSEDQVRVGRSWRIDELRIKSNEDLHKLWFVLLKERNMLLTMEQECKRAYKLFPNPERIDKVEESMENLELVVRERNQAYHLLETGKTGERQGLYVTSQIGLKYFYRKKQYSIPKHMNTRWKATHKFGFSGIAVRKFLKQYREKLLLKEHRHRILQNNEALNIMKRFPNVDLEALQRDYPTANIDLLKKKLNNNIHFPPE